MKYMTPERHQAIQDTDEDGVDWENALEAYRRRLKEIDTQVGDDPIWAAVRKFMATVCLHDADFDTWSPLPWSGGSHLQLVIHQRDYGPKNRHYVILRYKTSLPGFVSRFEGDGDERRYVQEELVKTTLHKLPIYDLSGLTDEQRAKYIPAWLYDEFDLFAPGNPQAEPYYICGKEHTVIPPTYAHNIIMSNGCELRILFTEFSFVYLPEGDGVVEGGENDDRGSGDAAHQE